MSINCAPVSEIVGLVTASAALFTALGTLLYIRWSHKSLKVLELQTKTFRETLEVSWLGMRYDAVERQVRELDKLRDDRHTVYQLSSDWSSWTLDQKAAVERVIRAFDVYGLMDRNQYVPRTLLHQFYAYPAMHIWSVAKDYIEHIRSPKGRNQPGHMWEFEKLHERAKTGPKHPAESGDSDWPSLADDVLRQP